MQKIDSFETTNYKHIDNGGIYFKIKTDVISDPRDDSDKINDTKIEVNTCYFGYPSIMVNIDIQDTEHLKSIIDSLNEHYHKLKAKGLE